MLAASPVLLWTTVAVYGIASFGYVGHLFFRHRGWLRLTFRVTLVGFALQGLWLIVSLGPQGYPFITGDQDAYRLISWGVVAAFVLLSRFYHLKTAGIIFVPAALLVLLLSVAWTESYRFGEGIGSSPWVLVHLLLAFVAFTVFLVSLVVGIAFIVQEAQLKAKHLSRLVQKLPPLAVLDQIHYRALAVGLILLTASILAGMALNWDVKGVIFTGDAKQIWILSTWLLYAVLLNLRIRSGWRGRRGIVLSILGFVVVVLGFFGLQHGMTL